MGEVWMKKILYVDIPFEGRKGGDKNRSSFIWSCLNTRFDADLMLIQTSEGGENPQSDHKGYDQCLTITSSPIFPYQPEAIYRFSRSQMRIFTELLERKRYEIVVFRFLSCFQLAKRVRKVLPASRIAIDVDMLFSRIATLSWQREKSIKNRYYLMEMLKLKAFEAYAFRQKMHFFFTNQVECDYAIKTYHADAEKCHVFHNMLPKLGREYLGSAFAKKFILFFGALDSSANQDAFEYLSTQIYPRVSRKLQEKDLFIYVVGKNPSGLHDKLSGGRLKVIGAVDDINEYIAGALFIILPLRIASGTRTRILEAAVHKKAVLTTSIGAEGFDFSEHEILIRNNAEDFAKAMNDLIQKPQQVSALGDALYVKAHEKYSQEAICDGFIDALQDTRTEKVAEKKRRKIAIVTNRFYPEVGGAETNIYYQAMELAKFYDITVICPKRMNLPSPELVDGIRIVRMLDAYNFPPQYPNLKAKTLCPGLFFHLISKGYDAIMCFPAINYNNMLAFLAAKLTATPVLMCFFDFIDYAAEIKSEGKIDPNILQSIKPGLLQRIILKGLDAVFAIADKEIDFIRRYNSRIEYSPVPIRLEEYENPVPNPRAKYHIPANAYVFLCLGRVSSIKGQDIALHAFAKALPEMRGARLVFVGRTDYEPDFYSYLESYISQNMLGEAVLFTGMAEREEVLGWLKYSNIHVIPVRFMNSGAVVVESWISGIPVIQSDVVDPNLVIEDYNGYLFKSENVTELAAKMFLAYHSKNRHAKLAENGAALVRSKYTYEYLTGLYDKTLENLFNRR